MEIKCKIWLEQDGKVVFGQGREELFLAIQKGCSLNAAAKKLGMSYRAAWGRLKASEARVGCKLVEANGACKAMSLTPQAQALLEKFRMLEQEIQDHLQKSESDLCAILTDKR